MLVALTAFALLMILGRLGLVEGGRAHFWRGNPIHPLALPKHDRRVPGLPVPPPRSKGLVLVSQGREAQLVTVGAGVR
jgi:hypothetical protein